MPKLTGLEIAKQLRLLKQDVKIMVLTTFAQEHYFQQALQNNVNGYMLKDSPSEELIRSIRSSWRVIRFFHLNWLFNHSLLKKTL